MADRERRHQDDRVAEGADDRAALAGGEGHPVAHAQARVVPAEVDPDHQAAAAHLGHLVHRGDIREELVQQADLRLNAQQRALLLEDLEVRDRGGAGERVAGEGVPMEEGPVLLVLTEEALVDPLRGKRRRERHVAVRQTLPQAEEVGRDALLLAGEHRPGPAEAGRDLVGDEEDVVGVAELANPPQVAGRLHENAAGPLHERLDDDRGDLLAVLVEHRPECGGVAGGDAVLVEEERLVGAVEEIDAAQRHSPDRVPVVALGETDEGGAPGMLAASLSPVLEGHLQGDLGRGGAGVRVEDAAQPRRRDLDEPLGQLRGGSVRQPEHGRVGDAIELLPDRGVDRRMPVTVHVAPQRRGAVDVAVAVDVDEVGALGPLDDDRVLLDPATLLREWVPEVLVVELGDAPAHRGPKLGPPAVGSRRPGARKLRVSERERRSAVA